MRRRSVRAVLRAWRRYDERARPPLRGRVYTWSDVVLRLDGVTLAEVRAVTFTESREAPYTVARCL
jgi:hypothetical protein